MKRVDLEHMFRTPSPPDTVVVPIRAARMDHHAPTQPCCDESEGLTLAEQRAYKGEQTPPYPPGRRDDWASLLDSSLPAAPHPTR